MTKLLSFLFILASASAGAKAPLAVKSVPVSDVKITWKYENFPLKIQIADIKEDKKLFISETRAFQKKEDSIITKVWPDATVAAKHKDSTPFALVIENPSSEDYYFFAVPHELNPHHASAGHYFECLCNGRVFKVPAKSTWYRIVRLNLNDSFQNLKTFEINHQIIGLQKNEVLLNYKERLYEPN
ncbi:MAG: hypothetical protein H7328_09580 [Bdellovibrio sp.]|nr:hypothetical protein [Bdellovibrio sp.]